MKAKIFKGSEAEDIREHVFYVMSKADLSIPVCSRRVITTSEEMASVSFGIRSLLNTGTSGHMTHMVIRFTDNEDQKTGIVGKKDIVTEFLRRMDWEDCQYLAVLHGDVKGNPHIHIVLNMIRDNGTASSNSFTIKRSQRIIQQMTDELSGRLALKDTQTDGDDRDIIGAMVQDAIDGAASLRDMRRELAMEMITARMTKDGGMDFGWIGEKERYSCPGLTVKAISRMLHGEEAWWRLKKVGDGRRRASITTGWEKLS